MKCLVKSMSGQGAGVVHQLTGDLSMTLNGLEHLYLKSKVKEEVKAQYFKTLFRFDLYLDDLDL